MPGRLVGGPSSTPEPPRASPTQSSVRPSPPPAAVTVAVAVFAVALALIATERVDRTKVALLGATLLLLTQTLDQERAI